MGHTHWKARLALAKAYIAAGHQNPYRSEQRFHDVCIYGAEVPESEAPDADESIESEAKATFLKAKKKVLCHDDTALQAAVRAGHQPVLALDTVLGYQPDPGVDSVPVVESETIVDPETIVGPE